MQKKSDLRLPNLRAWRVERGMTAKQLAEAAGITRATVARLETGQHGATAPTVAALARALGLSGPHDLMTRAPGDEGRRA